MSSMPRADASQARRADGMPPSTTAASRGSQAGAAARRRNCSSRPAASSTPDADDELLAPVAPRRGRPALRARARRACRSAPPLRRCASVDSLRGVVLDTQPLADDVGVERFEPRQPLQPALEDRHLLVAVHALDPEDRLGVQLADGARSVIAPAFLDVRARLASSSRMWWSSTRVEHLPARAAGRTRRMSAKQPQLMRDGGLADPDERGDVADAELAGPSASRIRTRVGSPRTPERFVAPTRLRRERAAAISHVNI